MSSIQKYKDQYDRDRKWKCDKCGIVHCHKPTVHILDSVKTDLEYNIACNCGIQEAYEFYTRNCLDCGDKLAKNIERLSKYYLVPDDVERDIWKSVRSRANQKV